MTLYMHYKQFSSTRFVTFNNSKLFHQTIHVYTEYIVGYVQKLCNFANNKATALKLAAAKAYLF